VVHLINNQAVCSPGHILQLVSEAIEAGKVVSTKGNEATIARTEDDNDNGLSEYKAIVAQLKNDNIVTDAEFDAAKAKAVKSRPAPQPKPVTAPGLENVTTKVVTGN